MSGALLQLSGAVIDLAYRVRAVPAPGTEAEVRDMSVWVGGGFNAAVAASRAGMTVALGGTLGTGPFADVVAGALRSAGIAHVGATDPMADQGVCTVLVDDAGERTFIAKEGADGRVAPSALAGIDLDRFDFVLLSGYGLAYPGSGPALAGWLAALDPRPVFVFDPCPVIDRVPEAFRVAALARADWITANLAEGRSLTGLADPDAVVAALAAARRGGAVLRLGNGGCLIATAGGPPLRVPAFTVPVHDTNGAGDAHAGAFIAALSQGQPPADAAHFANAAAALSITREGPATSPTRFEIDAFLRAGASPGAIDPRGGRTPRADTTQHATPSTRRLT